MSEQIHECRYHSGCIDLMEEELAAAEAIVVRLRAFIALGAEQGRLYANWWELRDVLRGETTAPPPAPADTEGSWGKTPQRIEAIRAAIIEVLPEDGA